MPQKDLFQGMKPLPSSGSIFDGIAPIVQPTNEPTAIGVRAGDQQSIRDYIARLQAIKPANAVHKAILDKEIAQAQSELDGTLTRGISDPSRSAFENAMRGGSSGVITGALLQPAEMVMGVASHLPVVGDIARREVGRMQEASQDVTDLFDPQGKAGAIGEFAGSVIGAGPAYGSAAKSIATKLVTSAPTSLLSKAIIKASEPGAGIIRRSIGGVAAGLPLQVAQGVGIVSPDVPSDATQEQKDEIASTTMASRLKQIAIGIAADAIFGVLPHGKAEAKQEVIDAAIDPSKESKLSPERRAEVEKIQKAAAARDAVQAAIRKARKLSQADWTTQNPDLEWKNLTKEEKKGVLENWLAARKTSDTKTDTSTPTPLVDGTAPPVADVQVEAASQATPSTVPTSQPTGLKDTMLLSDLQLLGMNHEEAQSYVAKELASGKTEEAIRADIDADMQHNAHPVEPNGGSVGQVPSDLPPAGSSGESGGESGAASEAPSDGQDLSPEVQMLMQHVEAKGGLRTPEEIDSFITEIHNLDNLGLKPEEYQAHIKSIVEDFTPFEEESAQPASGTFDAVGYRGVEQGRDANVSGMHGVRTFSPDRRVAERYAAGGSVVEERIHFENPLVADNWADGKKALGLSESAKLSEMFKAAREAGYDGLVFHRGVGKEGKVAGTEPEFIQLNPPSLPTESAVGEPLETQPKALESQPPTPEGATQNNAPELGGEAPTATSVSKPTARSTFLETVQHEDPIEQWTDGKLNKFEDKLIEKLQNLKPESPRRAALESDLSTIMAEQRARENSIPDEPSALPEGLTTRPPVPEGVVGAETVIDKTPKPEVLQRLSGEDARKLMRKPIVKMTDAELSAHIEDVDSRISGNENNPDYASVRQRLNDALAERARRADTEGLRAQMPPSVTGAVGGFVAGYFAPADNDGERATHAWEWAIIGGAAGHFGPRLLKRGSVIADGTKPRPVGELPGGAWQHEVQKHIATGYVEDGRQVPWMEKTRRMYYGIVHRSGASEDFTTAMGGSRLSTQRNPAKLFSLFGRWQGQAEYAKQYGPALVDEFGNIQPTGAPGIAKILDMVEGDQETLGALSVARTVIEQGESTKVPIDQIAALRLIHSLPENFHQAADGLRQYSLGLAKVMVDAGVLSKQALDIFSTETFYAPLMRIFKFDAGSLLSAEKGLRNVVGATNPLKLRKGGSMDTIKNPVESVAESTGPIYRAAELNKIKHSFVDLWEASGRPSEWMQLVSKKDVLSNPEHENYVASLKAEIKGLSGIDASALSAALDPKAVDPIAGTMRVFRDGVVQTYKMPTELAKAMITLQPEEFNQLTRILGAPTRVTSKAVVLSPYFQAKMAFFDLFQATVNSQYGFRFGLDNIRGWLHTITRSKDYQNLLAAGYQHQSRGTETSLQTNLESIKLASGSPLDAAIKQVKEMKPFEAYKTLMQPLGDAARVGEALRALDHGASVLDAVYAAKQVTANYSEIGAFSQMRALNHMIMFLNPALQVMDQALYRSGLHPFRAPEEGRGARVVSYAAKAFMTISLPSYYFWQANRGDEEIKQLRQTQTGRRYWFTRIGGSIVKIPKPILDGQVWGTSMESALDQGEGDVNNSMGDVFDSALRDAAFNILPSVGVVPFSLASNHDLQWGGTIVPDAQQTLTSSERGVDNALWLSRTISKAIDLGPNHGETLKNALSPAGLDYLIRSVGGSLGQDGIQAVSQAMDYKEKGYIPVKEEMPITRQIFAMYPSTRVQALETFYDRLQKVDEVAATINHLATEDPTRLVAYMDSNMPAYQSVGTFDQTRGVISNLRRAIVDIRNLPAGILSSEEKHRQIAQMTQLIIDQANMANQVAESFEKHAK